jgi:lipoyl(octanoyl) transferase
MIEVIDLGLTPYRAAWELQRQVFDLRLVGKIPDVLLLNEHEHVYTLGRNADPNHLLADDEELRSSGIEVCRIDRGGDVTYHGPGQIVGYPIINLEEYYRDVHRYLRDLEEVMIRTLSVFGIEGRRDREFTGVWVGSEKIAAIGVRVSRWVTMHGFALNVNTDLGYFERIIPCGIFHRGVTSLQRLLGREVPLAEVSAQIVKHFSGVFGVETVRRDAGEFTGAVRQFHLEEAECPR